MSFSFSSPSLESSLSLESSSLLEDDDSP